MLKVPNVLFGRLVKEYTDLKNCRQEGYLGITFLLGAVVEAEGLHDAPLWATDLRAELGG